MEIIVTTTGNRTTDGEPVSTVGMEELLEVLKRVYRAKEVKFTWRMMEDAKGYRYPDFDFHYIPWKKPEPETDED